MKTTLRLAALIALTALQPAFAQDSKPSEQSVRQLLAAMHTGEALKDSFAHMDDMLRASTNEMHGRPLNAEQQKIRDEMRTKVIALMKEQLNWATLEPIMVESYRDTFTQQEVDALLKFYRTPIGKSAGAKLPAVSQQMMQLMQERIREMMPKIKEIVQDYQPRIRAAGDASEKPPQSPPPQSPPPPPAH